jgi:beta-1,4-N-acetylglucosaminyltransferase
MKTVFITVGSTKFEALIDRLLDQEILDVFKKYSFNKMVIQMGNGKNQYLNLEDSKTSLELIKDNIEIIAYKYKPSLKNDLEKADLVISHAGAGSIVESLEANKKLIVVINETLMDNHQFELAEKMHKEGYLLYSLCSNLNEILESALDNNSNNVYEKGNSALFTEYLDDYLSKKKLF